MAYLQFLDSKNLIPCTVTPSGNIVTLSFPDGMVVDTSGFNLYLDEAGEIDIGGEYYHDFRTIFRNDGETSAYNGYQLSNDSSVYVEPEITELLPEPAPPPTEEELAERERLRQAAEIQGQIETLKRQLSGTDYIIVKLYEYSLVKMECTEYDLGELHTERQTLRDSINELETSLAALSFQNAEMG